MLLRMNDVHKSLNILETRYIPKTINLKLAIILSVFC